MHFPDDPDYQLAVLTGLLRAVYGSRLDRPAITSILVNSLFQPTTALQAAVMKLAPGDAAFVAFEFSRGCLDNAGFEPVTRDELRRLASGEDQTATQPVDSQSALAGEPDPHSRAAPWRRNRTLPGPGSGITTGLS